MKDEHPKPDGAVSFEFAPLGESDIDDLKALEVGCGPQAQRFLAFLKSRQASGEADVSKGVQASMKGEGTPIGEHKVEEGGASDGVPSEHELPTAIKDAPVHCGSEDVKEEGESKENQQKEGIKKETPLAGPSNGPTATTPKKIPVTPRSPTSALQSPSMGKQGPLARTIPAVHHMEEMRQRTAAAKVPARPTAASTKGKAPPTRYEKSRHPAHQAKKGARQQGTCITEDCPSQSKPIVKASHMRGYVYMGRLDEFAGRARITREEVLKRAILKAHTASSTDEKAPTSLPIADSTAQDSIIGIVRYMCGKTQLTGFNPEGLRTLLIEQAKLNEPGAASKTPGPRLWPTGDFLHCIVNSATGKAMPVYSGLPALVAFSLGLPDYRELHNMKAAQHWKVHYAQLKKNRRGNA